ncbi:MAG: hypothetical protein JW797_15695 [Bradymonadales bacterium]|nr:hypothetical protein [Bradymonadales bacterium]
MTQKSLAMRARTRYTTPDEFVSGHGRFFDHQGMFVRTQQLKPPGTSVRFEFQLADGQIVFRGEGIVDLPPTMTTIEGEGLYLRLTRLDRQSKVLLQRIRAEAAAGQPFPPSYSAGLENIGDLSHPPGPPPTATEKPVGPLAEPLPPTEQGAIENGLTSADLEMIANAIENSLDSVLLSSPEGIGTAWPPSDLQAEYTVEPTGIEQEGPPFPSVEPAPIAPIEPGPDFAPQPSKAPFPAPIEPEPEATLSPTEPVEPEAVEPEAEIVPQPAELPPLPPPFELEPETAPEEEQESISDDFEIVVSPEIEAEQEVLVDLAASPVHEAQVTPLPSRPEETPSAVETEEIIEDTAAMAQIAEEVKAQLEARSMAPTGDQPTSSKPTPAEPLPEMPSHRFVVMEEEKPVISDLIADLLTDRKEGPVPRLKSQPVIKAPSEPEQAVEEIAEPLAASQPDRELSEEMAGPIETVEMAAGQSSGEPSAQAVEAEEPIEERVGEETTGEVPIVEKKGFFRRLFGRKKQAPER